jgi:hypothetical protein
MLTGDVAFRVDAFVPDDPEIGTFAEVGSGSGH